MTTELQYKLVNAVSGNNRYLLRMVRNTQIISISKTQNFLVLKYVTHTTMNAFKHKRKESNTYRVYLKCLEILQEPVLHTKT
jgi:hypothetical protein